MPTRTTGQCRRTFLRNAGLLLGAAALPASLAAPATLSRTDAKVALVPCASYGPELRAAMNRCFDLLGGLGSLVKNRTVAVKINLTGTNFKPWADRPVGETYMTHYATVAALTAALFAAGARRVVLLESTQSRSDLEDTIALAGWDLHELGTLGKVEYENTRNLGRGRAYTHVSVADGGRCFSAFELNHSYADCDVMVSLAKLKNHVTAGVTLSLKNLFGLTPNSLYGSEAGSEDATDGRGPLHDPRGFEKIKLPGLKPGIDSIDPGWRVPRMVADLAAARPVHLAVIDGIMTMSGGEGPWCEDVAKLSAVSPGILIAGLNPVSTDAVAMSVMGYHNPRAVRGSKPFQNCDNHLLLAEQAGVGLADLGRIEVRGSPVEKVRFPFG